jgi:hypothetical protein
MINNAPTGDDYLRLEQVANLLGLGEKDKALQLLREYDKANGLGNRNTMELIVRGSIDGTGEALFKLLKESRSGIHTHRHRINKPR